MKPGDLEELRPESQYTLFLQPIGSSTWPATEHQQDQLTQGQLRYCKLFHCNAVNGISSSQSTPVAAIFIDQECYNDNSMAPFKTQVFPFTRLSPQNAFLKFYFWYFAQLVCNHVMNNDRHITRVVHMLLHFTPFTFNNNRRYEVISQQSLAIPVYNMFASIYSIHFFISYCSHSNSCNQR